MSDSMLYHLVPSQTWQACVQAQKQYFPATYEQDGFIHLTKEPDLLLPVANHFYRGVQGEFVVLKIDAAKLTSEVRFEPAAAVGATESFAKGDAEADEALFPHLYGTIDFASVVEELAVERSATGEFLKIAF